MPPTPGGISVSQAGL